MRDELAWFEDRLTLRRISRQKMKVPNRYRARTFNPLDMYRRFQRCHCYTHVGGVGGNAVLARAQDGEHAVAARDRRTARSGFTLVARHGGAAKVQIGRASG